MTSRFIIYLKLSNETLLSERKIVYSLTKTFGLGNEEKVMSASFLRFIGNVFFITPKKLFCSRDILMFGCNSPSFFQLFFC